MPSKPPSYKPPALTQQAPGQRPNSSQRGYNARWQKARAIYLRANPLCVLCRNEGKLTSASVVDHVKPHKGDMVLFWDEENWNALCETHHNAKSAREK